MTVNGDRLQLAAAGAWTAEFANELEPLIEAAAQARTKIRSAEVDMTRVDRLDTFGAWLVERLLRAVNAHGGEAQLVGVSERFRGLLDEVRQANLAPAPPDPKGGTITAALDLIGRTMAEVGDAFVVILRMVGTVAVSLVRVLIGMGRLRVTSVVHHMDRVCWRAVPIVLLITFLIGCIIAQQGIFHFRRFGADIFVVDMIGVLVLREIGVLLVCIMVAGRSGSAYTAELGAMKMREEVDALRTMGLDPVEVLVLPRIVAIVIAVPILTFLGAMAALYGGGLVSWLYGGISPD
ncbi:MAG TPA: ABC transporter permease, partial [Xanthobacteraceae bacterium]